MTNGNDYLEKLNTAQRAAVEYLGGPQLVIAGAGSGKTRVLTYKIVHLLGQGCDAGRISPTRPQMKCGNVYALSPARV